MLDRICAKANMSCNIRLLSSDNNQFSPCLLPFNEFGMRSVQWSHLVCAACPVSYYQRRICGELLSTGFRSDNFLLEILFPQDEIGSSRSVTYDISCFDLFLSSNLVLLGNNMWKKIHPSPICQPLT